MGLSLNPRLVTLTILIIALISLKTSHISAQCTGDLPGLISKCPDYVKKSGPKRAPSKECCDVVKTADVACVCKYITKEVEELISMSKVVYVAKKCGKSIARGTKCGSYIVR